MDNDGVVTEAACVGVPVAVRPHSLMAYLGAVELEYGRLYFLCSTPISILSHMELCSNSS